VLDALFLEILAIVGFVIESDHSPNPQFSEDGDIVIGREGAVLHRSKLTPYLSSDLSEGELKATNF
jgi:hypothetical protein